MAATKQAPRLPGDLRYIQYNHALEDKYLPAIRALISKDLSEPYSIYVYRYFLYQWAHLCFMALDPVDDSLVGVIICKLEHHASHSPPTHRGYIAMLAVSSAQRGRGIATALVRMAIDAMARRRADEIVLETEDDNGSAMRLYEKLGFLRSKKLNRYYLNGNSAYRLVLLLRPAMKDSLMSPASPSASSHSSEDDPIVPVSHPSQLKERAQDFPGASGFAASIVAFSEEELDKSSTVPSGREAKVDAEGRSEETRNSGE